MNDEENNPIKQGQGGQQDDSGGGTGGMIGDDWEFPEGGIPQDDVDEILSLIFPPHDKKLDEKRFLILLAHTLSLTKNEKINIVKNIATLSQTKLDKIVEILENEKKKIDNLNKKSKEDYEKYAKKREEEEINKQKLKEEESKKAEQQKSEEEELRRKLGL